MSPSQISSFEVGREATELQAACGIHVEDDVIEDAQRIVGAGDVTNAGKPTLDGMPDDRDETRSQDGSGDGRQRAGDTDWISTGHLQRPSRNPVESRIINTALGSLLWVC